MKPKLREEPKEWLKFTAVMAVFPAAAAFALYRKKQLPAGGLALVWGALGCILLLCALRPRWFRGFYRAGMTVSFHLGQFSGRILLTLFFLVALTPLGLLLRLLGKDLLQLKRRQTPSYWRAARPWSPFDRQF
jgi:saxitoxin biosynthesis operon SxtJ-like protein